MDIIYLYKLLEYGFTIILYINHCLSLVLLVVVYSSWLIILLEFL